MSTHDSINEPIAIIGMACRFPGADTLDEYWDLLTTGKCAVTELPSNRWNVDDLYEPDSTIPGKINTRKGGFINNPGFFDAGFFGISPREAQKMDPQQRILLEVVWHAFEDANIPPSSLYDSHTGVFIGIMGSEWGRIQLADIEGIDSHTGPGSGYCIVPNRISYHFNFHGPSVAYDTACSSSLVAVHHACQSLRAGECPVAVAGGVNFIMLPGMNIFYTKAGLCAPDGLCKPFGANADGMSRSEGIGSVILKPLSGAIDDGDHIYAVILGSAVNQDGRSNGLTAPNRWGQEDVLQMAHRNSGINSNQVQYVEAHGTGTILGDLIEARALGHVMLKERSSQTPLYFGSVKGNMAHLEGSSGIAGLIKVALSLEHSLIPPSLHSREKNPNIDFHKGMLKVVQKCIPWPVYGDRKLAGLSSFGIGGTNAHLITESYGASVKCNVACNSQKRPIHLLNISAKSEYALKEYASNIDQYLDENINVDLENLCYVANTCRDPMVIRASIIVSSLEQLRIKLRKIAKSGVHTTDEQFVKCDRTKSKKTITLLFTGQGSQYTGMMQELYDSNPYFKGLMDECESSFKQHIDISMRDLIFNTDNAELLIQTKYSQPALFTIEYCLAKLLIFWGVIPNTVIGHSLGEYVAAVISGLFTFEDAFLLVVNRASLMQSVKADGTMLAVATNSNRLMPYLEKYKGEIVVAVENSPLSTVVSGDSESIARLQAELQSELSVSCQTLRVSHGFHSHHMDSVMDTFRECLLSITFHDMDPDIQVISSSTGNILKNDEAKNPDYWIKQLRQGVKFQDSIETAYNAGNSLFIEVGPTPVLTAFIRDILPDKNIESLYCIHPKVNNWLTLLETISRLWISNVAIDWHRFDEGYIREKIKIPNYPFEHKNYWLDIKGKIDCVDSTLITVTETKKNLHKNNSIDSNGSHFNAYTEKNHLLMESEEKNNRSTSDIINDVISRISRVPLSELQENYTFNENLGFDSMMIVELKNALESEVNKSLNIPLDFFFNNGTIGGLIKQYDSAKISDVNVNSHKPTKYNNLAFVPDYQKIIKILDKWERKFSPNNIVRTDKALVHQQNIENILIAQHRGISSSTVLAEMVQDTHHVFFYEHEQDHVPGLYITEAIRQFINVASHEYFNVPLDAKFVLTNINITFETFSEKDQALYFLLINHGKNYVKGRYCSISNTTYIIQNKMIIGNLVGEGQIILPEDYAAIRNTVMQTKNRETISEL